MIPVCQGEISSRPAGQISPYDGVWKLNFLPVRRGSFPPGISSDWYAISLNFSLKPCPFTKLKTHWFNFFLLEFFLIIVHKIRSSRSQMFFKMVIFKVFLKLQTWKPVKGLQHRCFPANIAKLLRTPFFQSTFGGCFCKMMKFYKNIC